MGHRPLRAVEEQPQGLRGRTGRGHRGGIRSLSSTRRWALHRHRLRFRRDDPTTRRARGIEGFALGTDSSPKFVEDARREAAEAGVGNIDFEVADAQTADWDQSYDYAFSRMGTQFFAAPVPAMRTIRGALKPGGKLARSAGAARPKTRSGRKPRRWFKRFLSRPDEYVADTCGPGPFSLGNPETTRGILEGRVRGDRVAPARLRLLHGTRPL